MVKIGQAIVFCLGLTLAFTAWAKGLCRANEETIFNCEFSRSASSLCVSSDHSVAYRAGSPPKTDLEIDQKMGRGTFHLSSTPLIGGGETHIRFSNKGYTYYLYDRISAVAGGDGGSAEIIVYRDRRKVFDRLCENDASIRQEAYLILPREDVLDNDSH